MDVLLAMAGAILNRVRGMDKTWIPHSQYISKYTVACAWGVIFGLAALDAGFGVIVALGMAFWSAFGWGDYFDFSARPNKEVRLIDWAVGLLIVPGAKADTISMSLRGLFILPMFVGLGMYHGNMVAVLIGLVGLLQGPIYYICQWIDEDNRAGFKTIAAEACCGALYGYSIYSVM